MTSPARTRRILRLWDASSAFLVLCAVALGFFVVATPPGWGLDEQSHVMRAYQVSEGHLAPYTREDGVTLGAEVPRALYDLEMHGHTISNVIDREAGWWDRRDLRDAHRMVELWGVPLSSGGETVDFDLSNAAASPFIAYLPAAAGFRIASWLDVGAGWAILLAKLCNAAVYVVGGWFALRLVRGLRVRWLLFAIALLPQAVFQAAYITADTYTNAVALVFVAAVLRLILGRGHPPAGVIVTVAAAGLGVVLGKPSYAILLALLLAVPPSRFIPAPLLGRVGDRVRRVGWSVLAGYLVVAAALTLALLRLTSNASAAIAATYHRGADPALQLQGILDAPWRLPSVLVDTISAYGDSWVGGSVGLFGYNAVPLPQPFALAGVLSVVLAALAAERVGRWRGALFAGVAIACGLLAIVAIYLSFSPVGLAVADGVQGRYFLPLLAPLAVGVAAWMPGRYILSDRASRVLFRGIAALCLAAAALTWVLYLF